MTSHGAHASKLTVAGREYRIRRSFDLACRLEEHFGPIIDLGEKLERAQLKLKEQADLYKILFAECAPPPSDSEIEQHIEMGGIFQVVADIHPIVTSFFMGEDRFMKRVAEQAARDGADRGNGSAQVSSPGASFSEPPPDWDGRQPNSGNRPFTN